MAPLSSAVLAAGAGVMRRVPSEPWTGSSTREQIIVEAWGQGLNVGALIIIFLIVLCNYRAGVLLHKLILLELLLALWHGTFIFFDDPAYAWVLSSTAIPLYLSYTLHNVVAWIKIRPFLEGWGGRLFVVSLIVVQPYWVVETWANFEYFNDLGHKHVFKLTRYLEPIARDPWWIYTTIKLVMVINKNYEYTIPNLVKKSPRFGVMLSCMFASIVFICVDIIATALVSVQSGINPYWRVSALLRSPCPSSYRAFTQASASLHVPSWRSSSSALRTQSSLTISRACSTASRSPCSSPSPISRPDR
jgi:hypothetical protein